MRVQHRCIGILVALCCLASASAQKINIGYIYPAGAMQGSTTTIAIGGQSIASAKAITVSGEGVTAEILPPEPEVGGAKKKRKKGAISDEDNLQLAQNIKVRITVDKDAESGIRDLKVIGGNGAGSNRLYFEVGSYPDFVESEPNNTIAEANTIEKLPATINGYIERCAVVGQMESNGGGVSAERSGKDWYSFEAKAGETIVAEVKARRFVPYLADAVPGWFQSVVSIYNERGDEVAFCDDFMLRVDPVIIYDVERSGRYYLKVHDSIYRGREDFVYRINLGVIPYVSSVFPLGGEAKQVSEVTLTGVNLGGKRVSKSSSIELVKAKIDTGSPSDGRCTASYTTKRGFTSNEFIYELQEGYQECIVEDHHSQGVGSSMESAIELSPSQIYNGKIERPADEDWYAIDVTTPQSFIIKLMGRRLGSPIDAKITLFNSKGEIERVIDDVKDSSEGLLTHHADPEGVLSFKGKRLGRYYIRISETQGKGGEDYSYRLTLSKFAPTYSLNIEPSSLSVPQGGTSLMTIFAERKYGFKGEINLKVDGLPAGYTMYPTTIPPSAKMVKVAISAPEDATVGRLSLTVKGVAKSNGKSFEVEAKPVEEMKQAFYISHLLPTSEFRVDITPADPFTIDIRPMEGDRIELKEGVNPLRIVVKRREGYNEPIQIMSKVLPWGLTLQSITIPEGASEGIIEVQCHSWLPAVKSNYIMLLATVKGSTQSRVAGLARNTIIASVMVNSPYVELINPEGEPALPLKEWRKIKK